MDDSYVIIDELEEGEIDEEDEESLMNVLNRRRPKPKPRDLGGHSHGADGHNGVKPKKRTGGKRDVDVPLPHGSIGTGGPSRPFNLNGRLAEAKPDNRPSFSANQRGDNSWNRRETAPPRPSFTVNKQHVPPVSPPYRRKVEPIRVNTVVNGRNGWRNERVRSSPSPRQRPMESSPPPRFSPHQPQNHRPILNDYTSKRHRFLSTIRRKSQAPTKPVRKTADDTSYDDLLKLHQEIQSKLKDLSQEESNQVSDISSDDLEDLDKENVKTTDEINHLRDDGKQESQVSRCHNNQVHGSRQPPQSVPARSNSRSSRNSTDAKPNVDDSQGHINRAHGSKPSPTEQTSSRPASRSSRNSTEEPSVDNEDEEETMLRNLALLSANKARSKKVIVVDLDSIVLPPDEPQPNNANEIKLSQDNYDDVEMELDSRSSSPVSVLYAVEPIAQGDSVEATAAKEEDAEEDEDLLRAMLLSSLKLAKPAKVPDEPVHSPENQQPTAVPVVSASRKVRSSVKKMSVSAPVHRPVVINLNEDTDSETEGDSPKRPSLLSIDDLLNSARQLSESNNHFNKTRRTAPDAPKASVSQLPESEANEYKRLKAEIAKREKLRRIPKSASSSRPESGAELTPGNNSPVHVPIVVMKDDSRLRRSEERWLSNRRALWGCSRELKKLGLQIGSKSSALQNAELKITKLKEQLTAAAKIADAQRRQLDRMKQAFEETEKDMNAKNSLQRSLELECRKYGVEIHGADYILPVNASSVAPKRKLSSAVVTPNNKKRFASNKVTKGSPQVYPARMEYEVALPYPNVDPAMEKVRLQRMEKEIAAKLAELRKRASSVSRSSAKKAQARAAAAAAASSRQVTLLYDNVAETAISSGFMPRNLPTGLILTCHNDLAVPDHTASTGTEGTDVVDSSGKSFTDSQMTRLKELQVELLHTMPGKSEVVDKTYLFDLHSIFASEVTKVNVTLPKSRAASPVVKSTQFGIGPYRSPLLHLKSYRFSPYFRTKSNQCISWPTYSHKLKTKVCLCRFDLLGTCNDDKCPWQHERDYTMSPKEVLCDILSYCPTLTDITNPSSPSECKEKIESYVEKLQQSNQDRMTLDELCVLLVGRVNEHLNSVPPHYGKFEPRVWYPSQSDSQSTAVVESPVIDKKRKSFKKQIISIGATDEIIEEGDVRYFHIDGQVDHIENALVESPNDTILWLRLAHRKLNTADCAPDLCLDLALNVLSRGLEVNPDSSRLWLLYLSLYDKHENNEDILQLCEQAVKFCSSYDVWWKYLQCARGFVMKETICLDCFAYLANSSEQPDVMSHHMLELLLYRVQLNLLCGRSRCAVSLFERALGKDSENENMHQIVIVDHLVIDDCCLAWLCYIYLLVFGSLPPSLFGFTNNGLGKLVNKTQFILPWKEGRGYQLPVCEIQILFGDAITKCVKPDIPDSVNVQQCIPVYRNLIALEMCRGRNTSAIKVCEQLLRIAMTDDVWILLASVHLRIGDDEQVRNTLSRALKSPNASPRLYCYAATFEMSRNNMPAAQTWIINCATSLFDFPEENCDEEEVAVLDASTLYSKMLGLPVICNAKFPPAKSLQHIVSQKQFIWLNYCMYLAVLGKQEEAKEAFEKALVRVTQREDLEVVWMHYLQYNQRRLTTSTTPQKEFEAFGALVYRCLSTIPCSASLPGSPVKVWLDYTFFNSVVDLYASVLSEDQRGAVYERFHELSPKNDMLAEKLLALYLERDECRKAWLLCQTQIGNTSSSLFVWKTALQIAQREKSTQEYIVFECLQNEAENARRLMIECKTFGIVIDGFFDEMLFS